jgi:adenosylcobinamide kinase/adenosylcobinamide-phosphate guanylyltransferase
MARRIAGHRSRRPSAWRTLEEPLDLAGAIRRETAAGGCLVVECLTLWLTNLLMEPAATDATIEGAVDELCAAVAASSGRVVLVGNETNMGVVPLGELSRRYCDQAGRLHQGLAASCDQVLLMVAGLPLALKGRAP